MIFLGKHSIICILSAYFFIYSIYYRILCYIHNEKAFLTHAYGSLYFYHGGEGYKKKTFFIERIKEIYEQTKNAIRIHGNIINWFWTRKGVRQGYPLRMLLFALVIVDVEEEMKKG